MSRQGPRSAVAVFLFVLSAVPAAAQYAVQPLATLPGGQFSEAVAINERGQIVGRSDRASNEFPDFHAVLWEKGRVIDLGTLPGGRYSWATDINNRGQIVGVSETTARCDPGPFSACEHAFLWQDGTMTDLGAMAGPFSWATAINERGQIVGFSTTSVAGNAHAVLWDGGLMDLGTLPGDQFGFAMGINNRGAIIGGSSSTTTRAFVWVRGVMNELAPLQGGTFGLANDINNRGRVVGVGDDAGGRPPVLWTKGVPAILAVPAGAIFGQANGISDSGDIVGSVTFADENTYAVAWRQGAAVIQLPIVPPAENMSSITIANDVNSRGEIVGQSQNQAVVWLRRTPRRR